MEHAQAGGGEGFTPLVHAEGAVVAGVAQLLQAVDILARVAFGHDVIDHGEEAAATQNARRLRHEAIYVRKVVWRDAAGHQVELGGGEGQFLGVRRLQRHVGDALLGGKSSGDGQHLRRDVGSDDVGNVRSEGEKAVCPAAVATSSTRQPGCGATNSTRRPRLAPLAWTALVA